MVRPRKRWSYTEGRYGATVRIYEPRLGAPLRWDWREEGERHRPEVDPPIRVRTGPDAPLDPVAVEHAKEECLRKHAELTLAPRRVQKLDGHTLTVREAYELYFDRRRQALPPSKNARNHHKASRAFWLGEIGTDDQGGERLWNDVPPADVWGALLRLRQAGQIPTAQKRLQNLRTLYRWLREMMKIRGLEDPTLGLKASKLTEGYTPRRPRLDREQTTSLRRVLGTLRPRVRLFLRILSGNVTRAIQVRTLMRSGLDAPLEPPPAPGFAPYGWLLTAPVKGQPRQLLCLTLRQRLEIVRAMWKWWDGEQWQPGYLAEWERAYQAGELEDYPLIPGGRLDRDEIHMEPISDRAIRKQLPGIFKAARIRKTKQMGFHAIRRAMSDLVEQEEGLDTLQAAGGWTRRETIEAHGYPEREKRARIERARAVIEEEEDRDA